MLLLLLQFRFSKLHAKGCTSPRAVEVFRCDASRKLPGALSGRPVVVEGLSTFRYVAVPIGRLRHDEATQNTKSRTASPLLLSSWNHCFLCPVLRSTGTQTPQVPRTKPASTNTPLLSSTRTTPPCHALLSNDRGSYPPQNHVVYLRTRLRPSAG